MHFKQFIICFLLPFGLIAQDSENVSLLYHHFIDTLPVNYRDSYYSECWGFTFQDSDYAVISSTLGAHFYDVTEPDNMYHAAYVPATVQGFNANWRDYHDYQNYLYTVNDGTDGSLQIIDFSNLPNSVEVVYDSPALIKQAHNIFIDTSSAKLYVCGGASGNNFSFDLAVYSLEDPANPTLIDNYNEWGYIHDVYARNDTAYLEGPDNQMLYVVDFSEPTAPQTLGSLGNYPDAGYTHAGWLTENGKHYVLTDETYDAAVKICDVSDLTDIQVVDTFSSAVSDSSMAHNVIIRDNFTIMSYYNDGLQIFDIEDPTNVVKTGFYDTHDGPENGSYRGAWGVYPFADGKVIIADRQTGLYVLDASDAVYREQPVAVETLVDNQINIFPSPANSSITITADTFIESVKLFDVQGKMVQQQTYFYPWKSANLNFNESVSSGIYFVEINGVANQQQKIVVQ